MGEQGSGIGVRGRRARAACVCAWCPTRHGWCAEAPAFTFVVVQSASLRRRFLKPLAMSGAQMAGEDAHLGNGAAQMKGARVVAAEAKAIEGGAADALPARL